MKTHADPDWPLIGAAHILGVALYEAKAQAYRGVEIPDSTREWLHLSRDDKQRYIDDGYAWLKGRKSIPPSVITRLRVIHSERPTGEAS